MEDTLRLHHTLIQVLGQHRKWLDLRHVKTLAWMMVGLIQSGKISLTAWVPYVQSRAKYAQSTVRRFIRWLNNPRIKVHDLYGPLIQQALAEWGDRRLYLALDTSMLWGQYCLIRVAVIYRGRAIPMVWKVIKHKSSSVAYETYKELLDKAATLLPVGSNVTFLADRGFADVDLMKHLKRLKWHWRIRIKGSFWIYRQGHRRCKVKAIPLASGQARFWHHVYVTAQQFGPVHLAIARPSGGRECWFLISDEPTGPETFDEYGLRFDIEENFLDDKSNGFQLESSRLRSADVLSRLCFLLAITTLHLVSQGTEVVSTGKRRWVDPHWFRGSSYLKIGWDWIKMALTKGLELITRLHLSGEPDPQPAMASRKQHRKKSAPRFSVQFACYAE